MHSCRVVGISYPTLQTYRHAHPEFDELVKEAEEQSIDELEVEAHRRARAGSDTLLKLLLASKRPEKYSQRSQVEHTGNLGHEIRIVEDAGWFGNAADNDLAEGHEASASGDSVAGTHEALGVRPTMGEDDNGPAVLPEGARTKEGDKEGSD